MVYVPKILKVALAGSFRTIVIVTLSSASFAYLLWKRLGQDEDVYTTGRKKKFPPGLINTGNICFMNSLLQSVASSTPFVIWIKNFSRHAKSVDNKEYLADVLLQIAKVLNGELASSSCYDASELLQAMTGRGWQIPCEEQDVHEFFHAVMTTLNDEYCHMFAEFKIGDLSSVKDIVQLPLKISDRNSVDSKKCIPNMCPFRGSLASILQCQTCGHLYPVRCDGFDSLSIPVGNSLSYGLTLIQCLEKFLYSEVLSDVECENCTMTYAMGQVSSNLQCVSSYDTAVRNEASSDCLNNGTIHSNSDSSCKPQFGTQNRDSWLSNHYRQSFVHKLEVLKSVEMESVNDRLSSHHTSVIDGYHFPKPSVKRRFQRTVYIAKLPQCLCIHLQRLVWVGGNPVKMMNFVYFPEILDLTSMTFAKRAMKKKCDKDQNSRPSTTRRNLYRLAAVIVHVGDSSCQGHFYTYRKGIPKDGKSEWIFTSDTLVRKASRNEVFSCPAYMLFYDKISDPPD